MPEPLAKAENEPVDRANHSFQPNMSQREPHLTEEIFLNTLAYIDRTIEARNTKLQGPLKKPQVLLYATFRDRYEQVFMGYSVGEDADRLSARFPAVMDAYEAYLRGPVHEDTDFASIDGYVVSLWLVSFAIIFKIETPIWNRLLACIDNEGCDALFEALVATRTPNRKQATRLQHAAIFEPLFNATTAKGESRDAFIKRYLKDWYVALKDAYWIGTHRRPDGGFFGYWAVEVAGVIAAFDMDDSPFRDMPYYPKDLVR